MKTSLPFAIIATDAVCFRLIDGELSVLLGKTAPESSFPGKWALIGGLVLNDETADCSATRHLRDKAGIDDIYKEQLYTFSALDRDPRGRVVSVAYVALTNSDVQDRSKARVETKWCPVSSLPKLAYDHDEIVRVAIERLRSRLEYTTVVQFLLPDQFTLSDLQKAYEAIIGKEVDKRNFRKKILAAEVLKDTGKQRKEGTMRPAELYAFSSKKPKIASVL